MRKLTTRSIATVLVLLLFLSPAFANGVVQIRHALSHANVNPNATLLDASFNPQTVGGVPFCRSGALGTILCYPPSFLKTAYGFPSGLDGTGSTIVIVDAFGSPTIQDDLNAFDAAFGLPAAAVKVLCGPTWREAATDDCPVKTIEDLSTAPNAELCGATGWAEETTLDVTMAHGLAPGAKIVLVVVNDCFNENFNVAEGAVVAQRSLRGSIMSQSFGSPDDLVDCVDLACTIHDSSLRLAADAIYQQAARNQWTVIASSGDWGANTARPYTGTFELTPSWPASSPLNLAAGGTQGNAYGGQYGAPPGPGNTFTCAAHTNCSTGLVMINGGAKGCTTAARPGVPSSCIPVGYGGEGAWNEFNFFGEGTSTGGGISSLYPRPSYQSGLPRNFHTLLGETVKANGRLNPDVSFNAAIHGGVLAPLGMLVPGATIWAVFGGTSASSPGLAAVVALANQLNNGPVGFINPTIYSIGRSSLYNSAFHDIRVGNNSDAAGGFGVDGFVASRGYDLTTGWGTPRVTAFINAVVAQLQNEQ